MNNRLQDQRKGYTLDDLKNDLMTNNTHQYRQRLDRQGADLSMVQVQVREAHRQLILNHIRTHGPTPQITIARLTGLSRTTISNIIGDLKRDGWVEEGDQLEAAEKGGRRPTLISFKADAGYVIGIDIGLSHFTILLTDLEANIIAQKSGPFDAYRGGKVCLQQLVEELQAFLAAGGIRSEKIIGIGVGIPGILDRRLHSFAKPAMLPGWDDMDVPQYLQRRLKAPVYLDNDANLGALGESRYGEGRGVANLVYVKIGTGIGAGLIIDGHLYRGSRGAAGELGHVKINASSMKQQGENCRNYSCTPGCLENLADEPAILSDAQDASAQDEQSGQPEVPQDDFDERTIAGLVRSAQCGDTRSIAALEHAATLIGMVLGSLINIFDPDLILLDGGVVRDAGELLLAPLRREANTVSLPLLKNTPMKPGKLGQDAIALGAVATVIDGIDIAFTQSKAAQSVVLTSSRGR